MRRLALIVTCLMLAWPAAAQEGRLSAEFRGERERLEEDCGALKKVISCATTLATDHPIHVALGSIAPQNGFGLGLSFGTAHNPSENWRVRWSADGVGSFDGAWRAGGSVKLIPTYVRAPTVVAPGSQPSSGGIHPYPIITIQAQIISLPTLSFFGLGPDSSREMRTAFGMQQTIGGVNAVVPLGIGPLNLSLLGEAQGRDVYVVRAPAHATPPIVEFNSNTSAPGLDSQPQFIQFGEGVRARPVLFNGRARLDYSLSWQQFIASDDKELSFNRLTFDLRHEFPIYRDSPPPRSNDTLDANECPVDPATNRCPGVSRNRFGSISLRALHSRSQVSGSNAVPFYFQQTLGGSDINGNRMLAAYDDYRFRGPHLLLFQESIEHSIGRWPVGVWFAAEQGQVALQRAQFEQEAFKASFSGGLSLRLGGFPQVIVSVANGSEGSHFAFTMSTSLLGGGTRPSLH